MLNKIKALADEAIALQNKNRMDEVLREISALCEQKQTAPVKQEPKVEKEEKAEDSKPSGKSKEKAK